MFHVLLLSFASDLAYVAVAAGLSAAAGVWTGSAAPSFCPGIVAVLSRVPRGPRAINTPEVIADKRAAKLTVKDIPGSPPSPDKYWLQKRKNENKTTIKQSR